MPTKLDDGKISPRVAKIAAYNVVLSPYPFDDRRCEGVRSHHEEGEAGQDSGGPLE
jgi:hypothetical protein